VVDDVPIVNMENFTLTQNNATTWVCASSLINQAFLVVSVAYFPQAVSYEFANSTLFLPANTMKLNIQISNWPFKSFTNQLQVTFFVNFSGGVNPTTSDANVLVQNSVQTDEQNSLQWSVQNYGKTALFSQFFNKALLDGAIYPVSFQFNGNESSFNVVIPHFWTNVEIDPSFNVLLDYDSSSTHTNNPHANNDNIVTIVIIVVPIIAVLVVVLVVFLIMYPRISMWRKMRRDSQLEIEW